MVSYAVNCRPCVLHYIHFFYPNYPPIIRGKEVDNIQRINSSVPELVTLVFSICENSSRCKLMVYMHMSVSFLYFNENLLSTHVEKFNFLL